MPILNWLTRDEDIRTAQHVPYRLLEEVPDLSAGDGGAGNMLIQGDNLEALKALLPGGPEVVSPGRYSPDLLTAQFW